MDKKLLYKFVLVEATYLNNERYWALFIEDIKDLFHYFEQSSPKMIQAYFDIKKRSYSGHYTSNEERAIGALFDYNDSNRKTFVDDIIHISDKIQGTKIKHVLKGEKLLVNCSGIGFIPYNKKYHTIIEIVKRKDYNFPTHTLTKEDIEIKKWEGGKHYYVKIGNHQLEGKFNTIKYAEEQANKFFKKLQRK